MKPQREAGRRSWAKHAVEVCPLCGGSGIIASNGWLETARKGGIKSYFTSLQPGQLSMRERGSLGGRPKALIIGNIERRDAAPGPLHMPEAAPTQIIHGMKNKLQNEAR